MANTEIQRNKHNKRVVHSNEAYTTMSKGTPVLRVLMFI